MIDVSKIISITIAILVAAFLTFLVIGFFFRKVRDVRKIISISFCVGFSIGVIGVLLASYALIFKAQQEPDFYDATLWLLLIFGAPTTLLYYPLSSIDIISLPKIEEVLLSVLFFVNWCIIGYLLGLILAGFLRVLKKQEK